MKGNTMEKQTQMIELEKVEKEFKALMTLFIKANTRYSPTAVGGVVNGLWSDIIRPIKNK